MTTRQKFISITCLLILFLGALVIRHQEAGYLAYLRGDFKTAEAAFAAPTKSDDAAAAYFVGMLNQHKLRNHPKAVQAYLQSARLGHVKGAIKYLELKLFSYRQKINCPAFTALIDKAAQTHRFLGFVLKAKQLRAGKCRPQDSFSALQYDKWAGETVPAYGSNFYDRYQKLSAKQRRKFDARTFNKLPGISDAVFLKFFAEKSAQIQAN